jgi:hypothetical protein
MPSVTETKPKRHALRRTVTLHLGNTLAEYQAMISTEEGIQDLIRHVEIADSLNPEDYRFVGGLWPTGTRRTVPAACSLRTTTLTRAGRITLMEHPCR